MKSVKLNVGGTKFAAHLSTLTSFPNSTLAKMVSSVWMGKQTSRCSINDFMQNNISYSDLSCSHCPDKDMTSKQEDEVFLDCDPASFDVILNYLRYRIVTVPPSVSPHLVSKAASSLGLQEMVSLLPKDSVSNKEGAMTDWIKLNVGGQLFSTTRATLTSCPSSSLARMFQPNSKLSPCLTVDDGVFLMDVCPQAFSVILNWLRYRHLMLGPHVTVDQVKPVADFFGLDDLNIELTDRIHKDEEKNGAMLEGLENCVEGLKDVLQEIQESIAEFPEKLEEVKIEMSTVASNMEDLWRIKCELTNMSQAMKEKI